MKIDVGMTGDLLNASDRANGLAHTGLDGLFTFEGNSDVFFPLVHATNLDVDLYTNVAIAFPRSPMHLAYQAWDLHQASGGRFALGLGTQIKPHIERRYSSKWSKPVAQMVELIECLGAIWDNWIDGKPLQHRGEYYRVDLMTPIFVPAKLGYPRPKIWAGALGPNMTEAMAKHADGVIIHPFNTGEFIRERTMPMIEAGVEASGRRRKDITINVGCITNPCLSDEEYEHASTAMRYNLAFYGSTPAYRVALDHHGLGDLQPKLREITKGGDWSTLGDLIDDEILDLLAVRGTPEECAARLNKEYEGLADRLSLTVSTASNEALAKMLKCMAA